MIGRGGRQSTTSDETKGEKTQRMEGSDDNTPPRNTPRIASKSNPQSKVHLSESVQNRARTTQDRVSSNATYAQIVKSGAQKRTSKKLTPQVTGLTSPVGQSFTTPPSTKGYVASPTTRRPEPKKTTSNYMRSGIFPCSAPSCSFIAQYASELARHFRNIHPKMELSDEMAEMNIKKCDTCGQAFASLSSHLEKSSCGQNLSVVINVTPSASKEEMDSAGRRFDRGEEVVIQNGIMVPPPTPDTTPERPVGDKSTECCTTPRERTADWTTPERGDESWTWNITPPQRPPKDIFRAAENTAEATLRDLATKSEGQEYARVVKTLGNERLEGDCKNLSMSSTRNAPPSFPSTPPPPVTDMQMEIYSPEEAGLGVPSHLSPPEEKVDFEAKYTPLKQLVDSHPALSHLKGEPGQQKDIVDLTEDDIPKQSDTLPSPCISCRKHIPHTGHLVCDTCKTESDEDEDTKRSLTDAERDVLVINTP